MDLYEAMDEGMSNRNIMKGLENGTIRGVVNVKEWQEKWWPPKHISEAVRRGFIHQ